MSFDHGPGKTVGGGVSASTLRTLSGHCRVRRRRALGSASRVDFAANGLSDRSPREANKALDVEVRSGGVGRRKLFAIERGAQ